MLQHSDCLIDSSVGMQNVRFGGDLVNIGSRQETGGNSVNVDYVRQNIEKAITAVTKNPFHLNLW
jgi:hypothetical protein